MINSDKLKIMLCNYISLNWFWLLLLKNIFKFLYELFEKLEISTMLVACKNINQF